MRQKRAQNEVEVKLRVADIAKLRRRLRQLHAQILAPRILEWNTLYDTPDRALARRNQMIRIRTERPAPQGHRPRRPPPPQVVLTYKGPSDPSRVLKQAATPRYKVRKELEVAVGDGEQMSQILAELRLRPSFSYEKFRTTYTLPGLANLKVELDETPIGIYLELEGPRRAINRAARLLGYSPGDYVVKTYASLYLDFCRGREIKPSSFVFRMRKK